MEDHLYTYLSDAIRSDTCLLTYLLALIELINTAGCSKGAAVGRTIERVQPGKLVGLLVLEFTHPRRVFALHLISFSSQSSAVRYRE